MKNKKIRLTAFIAVIALVILAGGVTGCADTSPSAVTGSYDVSSLADTVSARTLPQLTCRLSACKAAFEQ